MKKKLMVMMFSLSILLLAGCGKSDQEALVDETDMTTTTNNTIIYTLEYDHQQYQFNMLDGWRKFPNSDHSIAFLVGNKDQASFMSAGFMEKEQLSLEDYLADYMTRLKETDATVTIEPKKEELNGLDSYYLGVDMLDERERVLTYRIHLIETSDYFINLGAWTSEQEPSKDIIKGLDDILNSFKEK